MMLLPRLRQMPEGKACPPQTVRAIEPIAGPTGAVAYGNHGFHYGPAFEQHLRKYDMGFNSCRRQQIDQNGPLYSRTENNIGR